MTRFATKVAGHRIVSVCAAVLQAQADGRVAVTMGPAGHPPAIVRRADGSVEFVAEHGGRVLGVVPAVDIPERDFVLDDGDRLPLYTDGVKRAGSPASELASKALVALPPSSHRRLRCRGPANPGAPPQPRRPSHPASVASGARLSGDDVL